MRPLTSAFALLVYALLLGACEDPPPPPPPARPPPTPPEPIAAGRTTAGPAAFDLVPSASGALFAYGAPHSRGGGVMLVELGPMGEAVGVERAVTPPRPAEARASQAVEVEMGVNDRDVVVSWALDFGRGVTAFAAHSPDGGARFRPPVELESMPSLTGSQRGRLAVSAYEGGTLAVRARRLDGSCDGTEEATDSDTSCGRIALHRVVGDSTGRASIRTLVPIVCEPFVFGGLLREGSSFHGLCGAMSGVPGPNVTVLDPDPQLATVLDTAAGCTPVGIAPVEGGAAVVARCPDGAVSATVVDAQGRVLRRLPHAEPHHACERGRMVVELVENGQRAGVKLGARLGRLEALLAEDVAPPGSRAVWTGQALLIAAPIDTGEVALRRYECGSRDRFLRTDSY
ncbi:MAG: hypothetical protein AB8I08_22815 [Sandaracinaceae bacterium]